eukprot:3146516-Prymnesium_polylepis.1
MQTQQRDARKLVLSATAPGSARMMSVPGLSALRAKTPRPRPSPASRTWMPAIFGVWWPRRTGPGRPVTCELKLNIEWQRHRALPPDVCNVRAASLARRARSLAPVDSTGGRQHSHTHRDMFAAAGLVLITSSGYLSPKLTLQHVIAKDPSGNLRDPSAMIQDPKTLHWHFWVVFVPGSAQPGWAGYLHHYSSDSVAGPFVSHGLALNHSADPGAFDHHGMFSPSAVYDAASERWYLFYSGTGSNYTEYKTSAQLVASAASPEGPWVREGVVAYPTGSAALGFNRTWNSRRVDSGRAVVIDGRRGY